MGDAEGVTGDLHAPSRALALVARSRRSAEWRRLERAPDVPRGDVARERCQRVVERGLVSRVLVEREAAVLPRRQDRPRRRRVVDVRCGLERREHDRRRCDERRGERGEAAEHVRDGTALATQYSPLRGCAARVRRGADRAPALGRSRTPVPGADGGRSSLPGRQGSPRTRWQRALSRGVPRPAGARRRSASTTSAEGSSPPRCSARDRCCSCGRRWVTPVALVYVGLAVGVAIAAPLQTELAGTEIPEAQDVLELWPARILAILGNSLGTLAVVVVAHRDVPCAPARQRLDPRGDRGRGDRKRPRRARRRSASARRRSRRRAPLRRVRGPGAAHEATPRRARRPPRGRSTPRRSRRGCPRAPH